MAIVTILETLLEMGGSLDEAPTNFETQDNGEYTFDATYTNGDGDIETIPMEVSIDTYCDRNSILKRSVVVILLQIEVKPLVRKLELLALK